MLVGRQSPVKSNPFTLSTEDWNGAMADTQQVLDMIKEHDAKYVDFRFTDPRGKWQHLAHHVRTITDEFLNDGVPFDGSSIAGWKAINESDMLLVPDCTTAVLDPFAAQTSVILFCDVHAPAPGVPFLRRPRAAHRPALRPRPALDRQEGRAVPRLHRHRRQGVFR